MRIDGVFLLILGFILLFSQCDNNMEGFSHPKETPVPIRMAVEESILSTRAPVTKIDASNISNVGIYGVQEGSTSGVFPWTTSPLLSNLSPSGFSNGQISFSPTIYYPLGGKQVKFYGYYPRTVATSGNNYIVAPGNGTAPVYNFTLTGQEDVMHVISTPWSGYSNGSVPLVFNHKLTQIILNTSLLGALSSVKLIGVKYQGAMNLETGNIVYSTSTTTFTLSVQGLGGPTATIMVPANVDSYKVEVALLSLLKNTYIIKPTSGNFLPGVIYTITL